MTTSSEETREQVRARYAAAAEAVAAGSDCGCSQSSAVQVEAGCSAPSGTGSCCTAEALDQDAEVFGAGLYSAGEQQQLPAEAVAASLGCGNPLALAELAEGEVVLDLGSGGGIDVLLSARRVGSTGKAYGLDMTEEMLALARANAARAGATNVEFLEGQIEHIPLPAETVDVVISNCVINLSTDKPAVLAEMFRVLRPGGRIGISDVVAEDTVPAEERAARGSYTGCIAGALSRQEYLDGLTAAGFTNPSVTFTHEAVPGMHAATVRATKPATATATSEGTGAGCCSTEEHAACCDPAAKTTCCGQTPAEAAPAGPPAACGCR